MIKGLYAAATGMMAIESRQDVIANNIANVSTPGFRRQEPIQKGFYDLFVQKLTRPIRFRLDSAPGGGVKLDETFTDLSAGIITATDNPMNIALSGPGFLVVDTPGGERYTRSGKLLLDADGQLATPEGFKLLGAGGAPIAAGGGNLLILENGTVTVDGEAAGTLQLVEFEQANMLTHLGEGLYVASEAALERSGPAERTTVTHKALEMSNVNLPKEMIALLLGARAYAANQRVINAIDETASRVIERVGMPA